jgi:hypothetical protein
MLNVLVSVCKLRAGMAYVDCTTFWAAGDCFVGMVSRASFYRGCGVGLIRAEIFGVDVGEDEVLGWDGASGQAARESKLA